MSKDNLRHRTEKKDAKRVRGSRIISHSSVSKSVVLKKGAADEMYGEELERNDIGRKSIQVSMKEYSKQVEPKNIPRPPKFKTIRSRINDLASSVPDLNRARFRNKADGRN